MRSPKEARVLKIMAEIAGEQGIIDKCTIDNKDYSQAFAEFMASKNPDHRAIRSKKIAEYESQLKQLLG